MSKGKEATACKAVLEYLIQQNRPYSAQDVFQNMGKDLGKTAVVRALETLAETKQIKEKIYGKQKVYVADQSQLPALNENEIKAMDQQITQLTGQLQQSQVETQRLEGELQNYKSLLSTEEAKAELQKTIRDVEQLTAKIQQLKEGRVLVSKEDREKVLKRRNHYVKEWRKRKRISMDIVGAVLEGYQKTKRQLLEEIGIETDEDHSVVPPDI
ncbi:homologous-pairing protein 2 homolog isoform X1 [Pomacea canaliculata]|uniref:homologous-pairing protein 2 homolog isoform X1 n=1 Tax=Pomacea canaliculata TaxID=400727 RepID=UPI000D73E926|nr:homologous-pairing protein 2 homolog isoform X1 [Pomacea canaliculata]